MKELSLSCSTAPFFLQILFVFAVTLVNLFFVFSVSKKKEPSCLLSRPRCASADEVISGVL